MNENEEYTKTREEQIVFGWDRVDKAAAEVFSSVNRSLLDGVPIFLYKNTSSKSDLIQAVVVRNLDYENRSYTDFGVGVIAAGYSMLYPHIPMEYLETDFLNELEKFKVDKQIIETYKQIIERIKLDK